VDFEEDGDEAGLANFNEDVMKVREDSQIGTILSSISPEAFSKYLKVFQKHNVSYLQFLLLDEEDLKEMGIEEVEVRQGLLSNILETRKASRTPGDPSSSSSVPITSDKITMADVVCMVSNIDMHVQHLGAVARCAQRRVARDPQSLKFGREETSIKGIIASLDKLGKSNFSLGKQVVELTSLLDSMQQQRSPGNQQQVANDDNFEVDMQKFLADWDALEKKYKGGSSSSTSSWSGAHLALLGAGGLGIGAVVAFTFGWKYLR